MEKKSQDLETQLQASTQRSKELESVNEKLQAAQSETQAQQNTRLKDMQTVSIELDRDSGCSEYFVKLTNPFILLTKDSCTLKIIHL